MSPDSGRHASMENNRQTKTLIAISTFIFVLIFLSISSHDALLKKLNAEHGMACSVIISLLLSLVVTSLFAVIHKKYIDTSARLKDKLGDEARLLDALRKSEEKYRAIFDSSDEGMILIDKESGALAEFNDSISSMLGYGPDEFSHVDPKAIEAPGKDNISAILSRKDRELYTSRKSLQFKTTLRNRSGLDMEVAASMCRVVISDKDYLLFIFKDTSTESQIAKRLHEQMLFSNTLLDVNPVPVFYKNKEGRYLGCNAAFEKLVGLKRDALVGKTVYDISPRDIAEEYDRRDKELFENPGTQIYDWKLRRKDGETRDVIFNKATYTDKKGNVVGLIGAISDITELRQKKREIRQAYERWQHTFDALDDMVFVIDRDYSIMLSNKAVKRNFFGEFVDGAKCHKIIHGENSPPDYCPCSKVFEDGQKRRIEIFNQQLKSYYECSFYPVKNSKGEVEQVIHVMKDINARKKAEIEMHRSRNVLVAQNKSLVRLTDAGTILKMPLDKFMKEILAETSSVMKVAIASLWFFDSKRSKITCACAYDSRKNAFQSGDELLVKDYPSYFEAILHDKLVSADNAHSDPGTLELLSTYLLPNGITSMLDNLISLGREPLGVLCCEHVGEPRNWTIEETNYAISISNIISLYMQTSKAENTQRDLDEQVEKFNSLASQTDAGLVVLDSDDKVVFVNQAAETFLGEDIKGILGEKCPDYILRADDGRGMEIIRKNGSKGRALVKAERCGWEGRKARLLTISDISGIK